MRKILLAVIPLLLAAVTVYFLKPSEETCRAAAVKKLSAVNLPTDPSNIIVNDHFFIRTLKYAYDADTFKLGSAAFLQVRVKDDRIQAILAAKRDSTNR